MLFSRPFSHYLWAVLSLLAVGFFSSGAISWIAANWSLFSKAEKFGLVEGLFALSLVAGVVAYLRETRRAELPFRSVIWLFLSAVLIGGLFALIGQVYQTGANAWQLFAIWTVLQLPLLWALPNVANGLLWLVTLNTIVALALLLNGQSFTQLLWAVMLNLPLFFLAERFAETFRDRWRILAHMLFVWLLVLFVIGGLLEAMSRVAFWAITAGFIWYYRRHYSFLILGFAYGVVEGNLVILELLKGMVLGDGFILLPLFNLSAAVFATIQLHKRYSQIGFALLTLLISVAALSLLLFLFLILEIESVHALAVAALCVFGGSFLIHHASLRSAAFVLATACGTMYVLLLLSDQAYLTDLAIVILFALFSLVYYREPHFWLRVVLTFATLFVFTSRYLPLLWGFYSSGEHSQIANTFYLLLPLFCLVLFTRKTTALQATAWGTLLFLLSIEILQAVNFSDFSANAETELRSVSELFHAITFGAFTPEQITPTWFIALLSAFSPLWVSLWLAYQRKVQGVNAVALLLTSTLICIGFVAVPLVGLLFSLLLIAHVIQSRSLFVVGVVGLLIFLTQFYYNLTISLLFKSFLLMSEAVLLGVLAFGLRQTQEKSAEITDGKLKKTVPIAVALSLMTTLGLANFSIWQFEEILENGEKIVLKLAPVDPRSLMQGDYMVLNYSILDGLNNLETANTDKQKQIYVRLYSHHGVDEFCGYTDLPPTEYETCRPNVYLPIKLQHGQVTMAGRDFFFPEGKREHFEQAKYGEFRFKDGKLLLLRLLDDKLNAL